MALCHRPNVPRVNRRRSPAAALIAALATAALARRLRERRDDDIADGARRELRRRARLRRSEAHGRARSAARGLGRQRAPGADAGARAERGRGRARAHLAGTARQRHRHDPGQGDGFVVLGAHHDTKDIPRLRRRQRRRLGRRRRARARPDAAQTAAWALARDRALRRRGGARRSAFRDDGTRGSQLYVRQAPAATSPRSIPPLDEIQAMVLFDMVGDCDLQIPREFSSDERLYAPSQRPPAGHRSSGVTGGDPRRPHPLPRSTGSLPST